MEMGTQEISMLVAGLERISAEIGGLRQDVGKLTATAAQQTENIADLYTLLRDTREHGCAIGQRQAESLTRHDRRIERLEVGFGRGLVAVAAILGAVLGLPKIGELLAGWMGGGAQ
jgi:hypothetical protein